VKSKFELIDDFYNNLWKDQYLRIKRWYKKAKQINPSKFSLTDDEMDIYLAFFTNCYHLYDWLKKSKALPTTTINEFFRNSDHMKICHDLCIGIKHNRIDQPLFDSDLTILSEGISMPVSKDNNALTIGNSQILFIGLSREDAGYYQISKLVEGCMTEIDEFISENLHYYVDEKSLGV
jgi:hypothetical protein